MEEKDEDDKLKYEIMPGDVMRVRELKENSVDSVVTDPPYHLTTGKKGGSGKASVNLNSPAGRSLISTGFMGKQWDGGDVAFRPETWAAVMRVLKPGGYLLAFGGTRTYHRLACAIEDAGFEIRDQIGWVFGSGFPKSHNLHGDWEGWGTALKPAWEPICVARKPFKGTVAENVARWGVGALNIAGCRIDPGVMVGGGGNGRATVPNGYASGLTKEKGTREVVQPHDLGRWPANIVHDGSDEVLAAFPDAPGQCADVKFDGEERKTQSVYGAMKRGHEPSAETTYADSDVTNFAMKPGARRLDEGSAARFFYCAKADRTDRNEGCEAFDSKPLNWSSGAQSPGTFQAEGTDRTSRNNHPTVKPTDLMRWLLRLVTPPGGTTLDCFMGSGSTLKAALLEGFDFIGIEKEAEYCAIAKARAEHVIATDMPLLRQGAI